MDSAYQPFQFFLDWLWGDQESKLGIEEVSIPAELINIFQLQSIQLDFCNDKTFTSVLVREIASYIASTLRLNLVVSSSFQVNEVNSP